MEQKLQIYLNFFEMILLENQLNKTKRCVNKKYQK